MTYRWVDSVPSLTFTAGYDKDKILILCIDVSFFGSDGLLGWCFLQSSLSQVHFLQASTVYRKFSFLTRGIVNAG